MAKAKTRAIAYNGKCSDAVESGRSSAIRGLNKMSRALAEELEGTKSLPRRVSLGKKILKLKVLKEKVGLLVFRP
jgi:hypothetical protein